MDEAALITAFCQKLKSLRQAKGLTLENQRRLHLHYFQNRESAAETRL